MVGLCFGAPGRVLLQLAIVTCNGGMYALLVLCDVYCMCFVIYIIGVV